MIDHALPPHVYPGAEVGAKVEVEVGIGAGIGANKRVIAFRKRLSRSRQSDPIRAAALFTVLLMAAFPAQALTLEQRLTMLAGPEQGALHYEETRSSSLTSSPVTYRGRLTYDPVTGALTKWVDQPRAARLTLTGVEAGSTLEMQRGSGRVRSMPLERRPELGALLRGLQALISGDAAALTTQFKVDYLEGDQPDPESTNPASPENPGPDNFRPDKQWVLHLRPRDTGLAERLTLLEVRGQGSNMTFIDSVMADGERQSLRLLHPNPPDTAR